MQAEFLIISTIYKHCAMVNYGTMHFERKVMHEEKYKWTIITLSIVIVVAIVTALLLKQQYDRQHSQEIKEKVQINNKM